MNNPLPSYYTTPFYSTTQRRIEGRFNIIELQHGQTNLICHLSNRTPDLFNELLKRGIPEHSARTLFYEMTA